MRKVIFASVLLCGCTPYIPAPAPKYIDKIAIEFTNEQTPRDFYIQHLGNGWENVDLLKQVKGKVYDTIPFLSGQYRIVTDGDTSNIFIIK